MKKKPRFQPGRVFVVPLLGGGFAFGYATAECSASLFCNFFDYVGESDRPPESVLDRPIVIRDHQVGMEFTIKDPARSGQPWRFTDLTVKGPVKLQNRYVQMGIPPRRVDVLGEEPDVPLSPEEAKKVPFLGTRFPPYSAALVEVAVKRLSVTPKELATAWREGKLGDSKPAAASAAPEPEPANKKAPQVHIQIKVKGSGMPSPADLELRHAVEDEIAKRKLGRVVDAGGGRGVMDVYFTAKSSNALATTERLLKDLGLSRVAKVRVLE